MKKSHHYSFFSIAALVLVVLVLGCENPATPATASYYTVSFESNAGTAVDELTGIAPGSTIEVPLPPEKDDSYFAGWYTDDALTALWDFNTDTVDADTTLYAAWSLRPTYTVRFDTEEGSSLSDLTGVIEDSTIAEPTDPVYPGYELVGWFYDPELTDEWNFNTSTVNSNIVLYAKWNQTDFTAPLVQSFTLDTAEINTTDADQTVSFTLIATDESSLFRATVFVESPSNQTAAGIVLPTDSGFSGTLTSATYTVDITIPQNAEAGSWSVRSLILSDELGNSVQYHNYDGTLADAGFDYSFENTAAVADSAAPTIDEVTVDRTTIDTGDANQTVVFRVTATDDVALKQVFMEIKGASGEVQNKWVNTTSSGYSGTEATGTFTFQFIIPRYSSPGTWFLSRMYAQDQLGKTTWLLEDSGTLGAAGFDLTVENTATVYDAADPVVSNMTLSPAVIDTSTGDQTVTFSITASDDLELSYVQVYLQSATDSFVFHANKEPGSFTGTPTAGTFSVEAVIPQFSEQGTYTVTQIVQHDVIGNYSRYEDLDGSLDASWDTTFENQSQ